MSVLLVLRARVVSSHSAGSGNSPVRRQVPAAQVEVLIVDDDQKCLISTVRGPAVLAHCWVAKVLSRVKWMGKVETEIVGYHSVDTPVETDATRPSIQEEQARC